MAQAELTYQQKKVMDDYIEDRTNGFSIPIDLMGSIRKRFEILNIKKLLPHKGPSSKIIPVRGGFNIQIQIPSTKKLDFRFVLAHEFAHTYFYDYRGIDEIPKHYSEPYEEILCNYGARALLIPRVILSSKREKSFTLKNILQLSRSLDVLPQWLVARLSVDLQMIDGAFLIYERNQGKLIKRHAISTLDISFNRKILSQIRKLINESSEKQIQSFEHIFLGAPGAGGWFDLEIVTEITNLFSQKFYLVAYPTY